MSIPRKPSPGVHIYGDSSTIVFLTVTTDGRAPWLACESAHQWLREVWQEATGWLVGSYVLMPDHLHCLCAPGPGNFTMERWIAYWKDQFWKKHRSFNWKWQSRGWHHRLRSDESLQAKWHYFQENPVRAGFVAHAQDWPYQGRIHDFGITHH